MQIGFFVYQYAKLRIPQFHFDFTVKYLDRSVFQYCEIAPTLPLSRSQGSR